MLSTRKMTRGLDVHHVVWMCTGGLDVHRVVWMCTTWCGCAPVVWMCTVWFGCAPCGLDVHHKERRAASRPTKTKPERNLGVSTAPNVE